MKIIIFDTETTGLVATRKLKIDKQPEIIEFYGCLVDLLKSTKPTKELEYLIKPKNPIEELITKITTIDDKLVKDAPLFEDVMDKIVKFLETKCDAIIAHNFTFDRDMIEIELERRGRKIKWNKRCICTVEQTMHLKGFRLSQSEMHKLLFNEPFAGAHRAKADVHALLRCCKELFKRGIL